MKNKTNTTIEYSIRQINSSTLRVHGEPIVFKGFESLEFCIRCLMVSSDDLHYIVDEISTGHRVTTGITREAAIDSAQKKLTQRGITVMQGIIADVIAEEGRLNGEDNPVCVVKKMNKFHHAKTVTPRLQRVVDALKCAGWVSTFDLNMQARVTSASTAISELKHLGYVIGHRKMKNNKAFEYRLKSKPVNK